MTCQFNDNSLQHDEDELHYESDYQHCQHCSEETLQFLVGSIRQSGCDSCGCGSGCGGIVLLEDCKSCDNCSNRHKINDEVDYVENQKNNHCDEENEKEDPSGLNGGF